MAQKEVEKSETANYCGWILGTGMKVKPKNKWPNNCKVRGCPGKFFDNMKPDCAQYSPVSGDKVTKE